VKSVRLYAIGRIAFGIASLAAPAVMGRMMTGAGGELPDAQALLRGIGGRDIGLGLGVLAALRAGASTRPWIVAGVLADAADFAGMAGAGRHIPPAKRWLGLGGAGTAVTAGVSLLVSSPR
jgi:hypothetical protein